MNRAVTAPGKDYPVKRPFGPPGHGWRWRGVQRRFRRRRDHR